MQSLWKIFKCLVPSAGPLLALEFLLGHAHVFGGDVNGQIFCIGVVDVTDLAPVSFDFQVDNVDVLHQSAVVFQKTVAVAALILLLLHVVVKYPDVPLEFRGRQEGPVTRGVGTCVFFLPAAVHPPDVVPKIATPLEARSAKVANVDLLFLLSSVSYHVFFDHPDLFEHFSADLAGVGP